MNLEIELQRHKESINIIEQIQGFIIYIDYYKALIERKKAYKEISEQWTISEIESKINLIKDDIHSLEIEYKKLNNEGVN